MQTFLPIADFKQSAEVLDNKRLGKQRVECKQILICLGEQVGPHVPELSRWRNHPAVKMWQGYEPALILYSVIVCAEWRARGFKDSLLPQFLDNYVRRGRLKISFPYWFGFDELHASHRSNLLRKNYEHYSQFGWTEPNNLPYYWPASLAPV